MGTMGRITTIRSRLGKFALATLIALVLFSSSGCVLLWLGAAGTGGYMIRKGEDGESSSKKDSSKKDGVATTKDSSVKKSE